MTCALPFNDPMRGAEFSIDRGHRYRLWCHWERTKYVAFLMLNPSVADESALDPTLRRCMGFTREWSFGGFVVVNLFSVVSPDPRMILAYPDAEGDEKRRSTLGRMVTNISVLADECRLADIVIAGWGAFPAARERAREVTAMLKGLGVKLHSLGTTKEGHPRHPLYLPATARPIPYGGSDG